MGIVTFFKRFFDLAWLTAKKDSYASAWRYFFALVGITAVVTVVPLVLTLVFSARSIEANVVKALPTFTATVQHGTLSVVDLPQPYIKTFGDDDGSLALIVDTTATNTTFATYATSTSVSGILLARDHAEFNDADTGELHTETYDDMGTTTFTNVDVAARAAKLVTTPALIGWTVGGIVLGYIVLVVSKLIELVIATLIALIAAKLMARAWRWGELWTVGLYALTIPTIIGAILALAGVLVPYIEFLALLAFMLALVVSSPSMRVEVDEEMGDE